MIRRQVVTGIFLGICYLFVFVYQESMYKNTRYNLAPVLPARLQQVIYGYLRQVASELHFVQTAVFLGSVPKESDVTRYAGTLAHNYREMTTLYPEFIDPYYYCQSSLAHIDPIYTRKVNAILQTGIDAMPKNIVLRFFKGFNSFRYLNDPLQAAETFKQAARIPNAPQWFEHFAVILTAEGGKIYAGLQGLKALRATETNVAVQERYDKEIKALEQAAAVQDAITAYKAKYKRYPQTLQALIPSFLDRLPSMGNGFQLEWNPPNLSLTRKKNM